MAPSRDSMRGVDRIWSDRGGPLALARAALAPLGAMWGAIMRGRRALYERGILASHAPPVPVLSVGNLTVGGTGKTPFAAWVVARLRERATPAIVLRGYGGDEIEVHRRLNPGVPVVASADRLAAAREAERLGADVVVADDAFQHRRLARTADVVLLSVEQLERPRHCLPAGPWREPLSAAAAADLLVFTRKSAPADQARALAEEIAEEVGQPFMVAHLAPGRLLDARSGGTLPLASLAGREILAIAAVGEPQLFASQLASAGAVVTLASFRDHHEFTAAEASRLAARIPRGGLAVCTLKDAVKLVALWPASSELWYVSQQLVVEEGEANFNELLERVLAARVGTTTTAG